MQHENTFVGFASGHEFKAIWKHGNCQKQFWHIWLGAIESVLQRLDRVIDESRPEMHLNKHELLFTLARGG